MGIIILLCIVDMVGVFVYLVDFGYFCFGFDGSGIVQQMCGVVVMFQYQMYMVFIVDFGVDVLVQCYQLVGFVDGVYGIQVQVVEMIFLQLVQCILGKEVCYFWLVEIDGCILQGIYVMVEEIWCIVVQVVVIWFEVVVDYVEEDYYVQFVCSIDQCFELVWCVIVGIGCEWQYVVIVLVVGFGEFGYWYQFDGGDVQLGQFGQVLLDVGKVVYCVWM